MRQNPAQPRARIPIGIIAGTALVALLIVGAMIGIFWREWLIFSANNPLVVELIRFIGFAGFVSFAVGLATMALMGMYNRWASREAAQAGFVIEHKRAETQPAPNATSFTYHNAP